MQNRRVIALVALFAAALACGANEGTCGPNKQCYNLSTSSCVQDLANSAKYMICTKGYSACNGACFQPGKYWCNNGVLNSGSGPTSAAAKSSAATTSSAAKTTSSVAPTTSSTSAIPTTSSTSAIPTTSSTSAVPTTSSTSAVPTTSSTSAVPTTSSTSAVPTTSSTSAVPTTSSTSATPTTSSTSATPTTSAAAATTGAAASTNAVCVTTGCGSGLCNCNGACFQPGQYCCLNNQLTQAQYCPPGSMPVAPSSNAAPSGQANPTTNPNVVVVSPSPAAAQFPKQTADLRIINSCKSTLWFEARYGGQGAPIPGQAATSVQALPGGYVDYRIPDTGLSGSRFWAKYGCDINGKNCVIGDQMQYYPNPPGGCPVGGCTPPVDSLFEATWGCRPGASCNAQNPTTWFDTSQVDGWTIPYKLTTVGSTAGCDCIGSQCGFGGVDASRLDLGKCPNNEYLAYAGQTTATVNSQTVNLSSVDLRIISNSSVIGCMSPCKRLNWGWPYGLQQDESSGSTMWMCCPTPTPSDCSPDNGCITPTTCRNGPIEKTQFVAAVHDMAPGVYSYSYDDGVGLHACPAGVTLYTMEFCPAGSSQYPLPL